MVDGEGKFKGRRLSSRFMGEFGEEEDEEKVRDFERIGERGRVGRETIFRKVGVFG